MSNHLLGCPKEADPRNETCDCERLSQPELPDRTQKAVEVGEAVLDFFEGEPIPYGPCVMMISKDREGRYKVFTHDLRSGIACTGGGATLLEALEAEE